MPGRQLCFWGRPAGGACTLLCSAAEHTLRAGCWAVAGFRRSQEARRRLPSLPAVQCSESEDNFDGECYYSPQGEQVPTSLWQPLLVHARLPTRLRWPAQWPSSRGPHAVCCARRAGNCTCMCADSPHCAPFLQLPVSIVLGPAAGLQQGFESLKELNVAISPDATAAITLAMPCLER